MVGAARVSFPEMPWIIGRLPHYDRYESREAAAEAESSYRIALGRMLKECGDQLLKVVEREPNLITGEQHDVIDALVDAIGMILRRLNRQGVICLREGGDDTIAELEELDLRLILLLEEALASTAGFTCAAVARGWFQREALRLSRRLSEFARTAEERNFLLGLGWESELRLDPEGVKR